MLSRSHEKLFLPEILIKWLKKEAMFCVSGLRVYLDDPAKVKRLLLPTKVSTASSGGAGGKNAAGRGEASSPSLMNLLMGVKVLQQAIVDLLLDIMVECCQPSESKKSSHVGTDNKPRGGSFDGNNVSRIFPWTRVV